MSKTAFLFPGQGAQTVGMGRQLYETLPAARDLYDQAGKILGYDLADLCFNGPAERLNATDISQPAIFVTSLAALESLRASDPGAVESCAGTAGLSLGEYTANALAGTLDFADGLRLVQRRGQAMQAAADANPGGMVSILGLEQARVEELVGQARSSFVLEIANLLCPSNIAVSGSSPACDAVAKLAEEAGARVVRLAVAGAFHTNLMKPADETLAEALTQLQLKQPRIPVWSNVDAQPHADASDIRRLLMKQVLQPVLWEQTMRNLLADGFDSFYELGPGRVLVGLLKRVQRKVNAQNISA